MTVRVFDELAAFRAVAGPVLMEREVEHGLILGLLDQMIQSPASPNLHMVEVIADGQGAMYGFFTGHRLLITQGPVHAVEPVVQSLIDRGIDIPGVVGPPEEVAAFASIWEATRGCRIASKVEQRIYALTQLIQPQAIEGAMERATERDVDLLGEWVLAFQREATPFDPSTIEGALRAVRVRLAKGMVFVWSIEGGPVSLATLGRPTENTITVGAVYTPTELRGRGFASALVAAVSAEGLAMGKRSVVLYTDLSNPTSNSIYQRIGFQPVCDSRDYTFAY
jgi:ribosomal protein S18 acetylase RimI-like enzyme